MPYIPRSCWLVFDHRHTPNQLAENVGWHNVSDAEAEAVYLRKERGLPPDSPAITVIEIPLQ